MRPAPRVRRARTWQARVAGLLLVLLRRRWAAPARARVGVLDRIDTLCSHAVAAAEPESSFDRGLVEIRRTDPRFDPSRFVGYAAMMFRDAQHAWTSGDIGSLRDRITAEVHIALQAQHDRLRAAGRVNRVEGVEITAEITEAWQEGSRDYVTAYVGGSMLDYTVDAASARLVDGSRTTPRAVDEFWTFTRPGGLNFWMLSAIQTA